ncbi:MAG: transporter substrate-binding domain-containing protein [Ketobacteraceae bacterium]|nr:transporter substrate-binding domain-containing protein [Ketobacteraceae bacterium]
MVRIVLVLLLCCVPSLLLAGETTLTVAAKQIRGMVDSPTTGAFVKMLRAVEKISDIRFNIMVLPPARAVQVFETGGADILLPHPYRTTEIARSFYTKRSFVFHQCQAPLTQYVDLKGKSVAITRGYQYDHEMLARYAREIVIVSSDEIALRMLNQSRVDAVIGEEMSLRAVIADNQLENVCYDRDRVIEASEVFLLFSHRKPLQQMERLVNELLGRVLAPSFSDTH